MKKLLSLLLFILSCNVANSQIVKGFVMDQDTKSKISFATVYFNGTYLGTSTDQNGYFELNISQNLPMPLTISALGYYSTTLTEYLTDNLFSIYLKPKVYELKEVFITAKASPRQRRSYSNLFKKEFLGETTNAINCKIINESDIKFSYNSDTRTLTAFSSNPILIDNKYLGYKIIYFLDKFEFCYQEYHGQIRGLIIGNYKFSEDTINNFKQLKRFERRRKITYLGSRMHFFRELWENKLDSAGFELKDSLNAKLAYNKIVIQSDNPVSSDMAKYLKFNGKIFISYYSKTYSTAIKMVKDSIYFDKNGFFDPLGIIWEGEMSDQRIGDLLPFEYKIK